MPQCIHALTTSALMHLRPFLPLLLTPVLLHGQASPPTHVHSPADEPVALENMIVTATPFRRAQADLATPTSVLAGRALLLESQSSLGETLAHQPGVAATYFGPGASRPVVRGLSGDRLRIAENGLGSLDASSTSPDHAIATDPLLIERVEIVRGPATVLYGGNAIGGIVNVIDHRVPSFLSDATVEGRAVARVSSVDDGKSGAVLFEGTQGSLAWHVDAYRRDHDDLRIPGFAFSESKRAEEIEHAEHEGGPTPVFARDRLPNSRQQAQGGATGFAWIHARGFVGVALSEHRADYGIPAGAHVHAHDEHDDPSHEHEEHDVRIDLRRQRLELHGEINQLTGPFRSARFKVAAARYRHSEREGAETAAVFKNPGHDARVELMQTPVGQLSGAIGLQSSRDALSITGEAALMPSSRTLRHAVFAFEEIDLGQVSWQAGARAESQEISLRDSSRRSRRHETFTFSTGAVWPLSPAWSVGSTLARTERAPNAQELYANGPHAGTASFEIGDERLDRERSLALDLSLRRRTGRITGEITVFVNRFSGYIFPRATGAEEDHLPVYRYAQHDAGFHGAEAEVLFHLHESSAHTWDFRLAGDFVRGRLTDGAGNLPRITPRRLTAGIDYRGGPFFGGIEVQCIDRARHLADDETPTDASTLLNASLGWHFDVGRFACDLFMRGQNLANEEVRPHVSFLKEVAPLPGRNVALGLRVSF